jgi:hypothetical protein
VAFLLSSEGLSAFSARGRKCTTIPWRNARAEPSGSVKHLACQIGTVFINPIQHESTARIFLDPRLRGDDAFLAVFPVIPRKFLVIPAKAGIQYVST